MPDRPAHRERVAQLFAQDPDINDPQLKEFRMNLEENLAIWEDGSTRVRRWLVRSVAALVLGYLGAILSMFANSAVREASDGTVWIFVYGAVTWAFVIAALGGLFASISLAITYFVKYAPALKRARFDIQTSMIMELQEQMAQLRADLRRGDKA